MAQNTERKSFFEWALPDIRFGDLARFGIIGILLMLVLLVLAFQGVRHLSVDGGRDEIAAGYPGFDGGIPQDQIAAAFPGMDDPEPVWQGDPMPEELQDDGQVEEEDEVEKQDEKGSDDLEDGRDISDVQPPASDVVDEVPPLFRPGTWNISIVDTGAAECGYPDQPLGYDVTLMIALAGETDTDDDVGPSVEDDEYDFRIQHPYGQLFAGRGRSLPVTVADSGEGWSSEVTVNTFDTERGLFEATETYEAPDGCIAQRLWQGTFGF